MSDRGDIARIRAGLATLRELDPDLRRFGAKSHRYQLAAPLDDDDLTEVERRYGARLPDGCRAFVTELGDGGAGPYWGLHSVAAGVGRLFDMFEDEPVLDADFPFDEDVDFARLVQPPKDDAAWDALQDRYFVPATYAGTLPISDFGCGESYLLVVRGARAGEVWVDGLSNGSGFFSLRVGFLDFYTRWLDDAIASARAGDFGARNRRWASLEYGDNPLFLLANGL
jgi:hypothetical protein